MVGLCRMLPAVVSAVCSGGIAEGFNGQLYPSHVPIVKAYGISYDDSNGI